MTDLLFSVNVVAPLFLLMTTGYFARKTGFVASDFLAQMNRFVFQFLLPLMLFQDIRKTYEGDFSNVRLILFAVLGVLSVILISTVAVHLTVRRRGQRGSMIQGVFRSNFLIYGFPLATAMYGQAAVSNIAMLMAIIIPLYNIAAVVILTLHSEHNDKKVAVGKLLKDIVTNPLIVGCCFGVVFGALRIEFPNFIEQPVGQLAGIATPLALFVMGGEFRFSRLKRHYGKAVTATVSRLIVIPGIILYICIHTGFRGAELAVLVSLFATPTAVVSYIMADNMGNDGELAAQIVVLTTVASCVTIFLIVFILRSLGYL
ncbi:MAG: AEC family transporter [Dysgonamonadaceae bacterium]|jgi:predicted permease|nr:AEC family transporter [Dysgonamonadaceae bacterium]